MHMKKLVIAAAFSAFATSAWAGCAFQNTVPVKLLAAGFQAWKDVAGAMAECGNVQAELDQDFATKQVAAFAANPALYQIGGVANETLVPLLNAGTIRPLDDLVAKYGQHLTPNQLIKVDGKIMAIAFQVNAQHLMYRKDIFDKLNLAEPKTYADVLAAAQKIKDAGIVQYPLGGTFKAGFNLSMEFINDYLGEGGEFFADNNMPAINNDAGVKVLELMKAQTAFMDPEYLVSDSTYVQQQFQQEKIAIANLWASRAGAMDDPKESKVAGKMVMAGAPMGTVRPATTLWWDGIVIAKNIPDDQADAAFRVALEGMDKEMVQAHNNDAVWLVEGYVPGPLAAGAAASANAGAVAYPASAKFGMMQSALGDGLANYLTGKKDAKATLADIEAAYVTSAKEAGLIK
jgi:multiple sugar transport system substrate-binding protein